MASPAQDTLARNQPPPLVIQCVQDPIVAKSNSKTIFEDLGSSRKRIEWLHNSLHASRFDLERYAIVRFDDGPKASE
jgi:esterase/lipase